jgi:hypothetical protein
MIASRCTRLRGSRGRCHIYNTTKVYWQHG